jgi:hypothetical protein
MKFVLKLDIPPLDIVVHIGVTDKKNIATTYWDSETMLRNKKGIPQILIYLPYDPKNKPDYDAFAALVAHEAVHVTYGISEMFGAFFNPDIQEPQAYLVQDITLKIMKKYRKLLGRKAR